MLTVFRQRTQLMLQSDRCHCIHADGGYQGIGPDSRWRSSDQSLQPINRRLNGGASREASPFMIEGGLFGLENDFNSLRAHRIP